jgi:tetratricopeptide (TPR) repeat protein
VLYNHLGDLLNQLGKPDEAAAAFREGIRLKAEENIAACREALRLKPDDPLAHYNLGVTLAKQGRLDEAIAAYQEALRRKPDLLTEQFLNNLAWDFVGCTDPKFRDPKRVVEFVEQALAQNPTLAKNPELMGNHAPMLLLADYTQTYRQQCARLIGERGNTKDPRIAYLVARVCALAPDAVPDPNKLVEIAERAVQAQPAPHHLHVLGLAHYRAGQFDKAIEKLHKSMEGNWRANAANWLVLAMAHQRLGHIDEARKWFDKAARWIDHTGLEAPTNAADSLQSLHPHDSLTCMVLRREAEMVLGLQP